MKYNREQVQIAEVKKNDMKVNTAINITIAWLDESERIDKIMKLLYKCLNMKYVCLFLIQIVGKIGGIILNVAL